MPLVQPSNRDSEITRVGLLAALEHIPMPAFVVSDDGAWEYANARGRAIGAGDPLALREELRAAAAGCKTPRGFATTALPVPGWFLAVGARISSPRGAALGLTPRQNEVLDLVLGGATNRTIAELLDISERTVEVHLTTIYQRAGVENRASLVSLVLREP